MPVSDAFARRNAASEPRNGEKACPVPRNKPSTGKSVVGLTGFEPATLCSQSRCATKLRYSPNPPETGISLRGPAPRATNSIFALRIERYPRPAAVSACRSARSASPRWLIAFFSASESSAIVRPGAAAGRNSGS